MPAAPPSTSMAAAAADAAAAALLLSLSRVPCLWWAPRRDEVTAGCAACSTAWAMICLVG